MSLIRADARALPLVDNCVDCVVTSPPYWGLRDYGTGRWVGGDDACTHRRTAPGPTQNKSNNNAEGTPFRDRCGLCGAERVDRQLGLEQTPDAYVDDILRVFSEVRRVLKAHGTCWLNIGDTYAAGSCGRHDSGEGGHFGGPRLEPTDRRAPLGFKPKDLVGIPWRVAFALQADGWYLRSDIIWHKPNQMPESVADRPTKAHEYLFLLAKSERYYYDSTAIAELVVDARGQWPAIGGSTHDARLGMVSGGDERPMMAAATRNRRSVWTVATMPYSGAHFATMPEALVLPCILAGTSGRGNCAGCGSPWERVTERVIDDVVERGTQPSQSRANLKPPQQSGIHTRTIDLGWRPSCDCGTDRTVAPLVLDPFVGSGTVVSVAERAGRRAVGVDLSYQHLSRERTAQRGLRFAEGLA